MASHKSPLRLLDSALMYICKISFPVFLLTFATIIVAGGSPQTMNGAYYIVNHGQLVREISQGWMTILSFCEKAMLISLPTFFLSLMLLSLRTQRPPGTTSKK